MIIIGALSLLISFFTSLFAVKKIIIVSHKKHLFDEPIEGRKVHVRRTPNLGGMGVAIAILFTLSLLLRFTTGLIVDGLLSGGILLFVLGLADDLVGLDPFKKLAAQILAALIIVFIAGLRIDHFDGLFGIEEIPYWASVVLSSLFIIFLVNAVNLIDGINGLAGVLAIGASVVFSFCFYLVGDSGFFIFSLAVMGSTAGFLVFNLRPARIFMGDTGALVLGFVLAVFSLKFLSYRSDWKIAASANGIYLPVLPLVFATLIVPTMDTLRVFFLRLIKRKSPFHADRNHLHHLLLDCKLSHIKATAILGTAGLSCFLLAFSLRSFPSGIIILLVVTYFLILIGLLLAWRQSVTSHSPAAKIERKPAYMPPVRDITIFSSVYRKKQQGYSSLVTKKDIVSN